ncbi:MAG: DEAD/DEAH box helicase, partial [Chitinophagaceae bacterium]
LNLLLNAYRNVAKGRKTLIFNNGIFTSRNVCEYFSKAGYAVRHLDNNCTAEERQEIVEWFRKTPNGILSSVSILTTGFDEPTVRNIIIYRATTSLTLYHQMIGRGSRRLANKKRFKIIDLGGNVERFGAWDAAIDWQGIFANPDQYLASVYGDLGNTAPSIQVEVRSNFPNTSDFAFDMQAACQQAASDGQKLKVALNDSIRQHGLMCIENAQCIPEALTLSAHLVPEIARRVKIYCKSLGTVTKNYREWLQEDYTDRLSKLITKVMARRDFTRAVA